MPLKPEKSGLTRPRSQMPIPAQPVAAPALPTPQNAATLLAKTFAPVRYVIPGYVAEGCSLLAGEPKIGKSWFVLDAALAVAGGNGGQMFGVRAEHGDVLYLALEDNERRLKSRIRKVLGPFAAGPARFTYATEWKRADEGGLDGIEAWIKSVPKATLIIVDVLARFRPMAVGRNTAAYDADYQAISGLQGLASKYSVAVVIVHHLRKTAADNDPFDKVSGTLGLSGAADTILIIDRDGQGTTPLRSRPGYRGNRNRSRIRKVVLPLASNGHRTRSSSIQRAESNYGCAQRIQLRNVADRCCF